MKRAGLFCLLFVLLLGTLATRADAEKRKPAGTGQLALAKRPFTVVAVVDSGINPYHLDFRAPELNQHPSSYITGFPRSAKALNLSLDADTYEQAVSMDKRKWDAFEKDRLYWIPGTNIVGVIKTTGAVGELPDQTGHGTATASLAGGRLHGPKSDDILLVAVPGYLEGLEWAARQPWIDVITNSYEYFTIEGTPPRQTDEAFARASHGAVKAGKLVCFASGNRAVPQWFAGTQGPSWSLNVGAASEKSRGEHFYTAWPNDVLGPAGVGAANLSIEGEVENGVVTSVSAPIVCGEAARAISEVRRALGDYSEGVKDGFATGNKMTGAYLEDGCLDRVELEDALQATAVPAETSPPDPDDPYGIPAVPVAGFVRGGYGIVDHDSASAAIDVLLGRAPRPDRTLEDEWITRTDAIRDMRWGPAPDPVGCP